MNDHTITRLCAELEPLLKGQRFGKVFPLSRFRLAIDFRLADSRFLLISAEPAMPRAHLIKRRLRDLEKESVNPGPFTLVLRKRLAGSTVEAVEKIAGERILRIRLRGTSELGDAISSSLIIQLTGRSANMFLLDAGDRIIDKLRETSGEGQELSMAYAPPARTGPLRQTAKDDELETRSAESVSEVLDRLYLEKEAERTFQSKVANARNKLRREIEKREKLIVRLREDLAGHGDGDQWKRCGDLILANLADAVREDGKILVVDYFDENAPVVGIDAEEGDSLTETAEKYFRRYTKARSAREQVTGRLKTLETELEELRANRVTLEEAIASRDESILDGFTSEPQAMPARNRRAPAFTGVRRFMSSDGYEILVGKASKDNDHLTFRVAKSLDFWLHAADYPGSHVVVRNPNRGELPVKTLLEAAGLAAFYSNARQQPKVAVNYTQKKFVNKPKGAAPGLVSLSAFKTIMVEPKVEVPLM